MAYRDRITIRRDVAADGDPNPSFAGASAVVLEMAPAEVRATGGGEKIRGRQIESTTAWVVELAHAGPSQVLSAEMRVEVVGGLHSGRTLEIKKALPLHPPGQTPIWQLECVETN